MKVRININIDVKKILKERLFKGEKGTYLDLTTIVDLDNADQYGNHGFICQNTTKEEQENEFRTPSLGNCKVVYRDDSNESQKPAKKTAVKEDDDFDDDIPF